MNMFHFFNDRTLFLTGRLKVSVVYDSITENFFRALGPKMKNFESFFFISLNTLLITK